MANIKIVDDDKDYAEAISIALREKGHQVSICACIETAYGDLIRDKPDLLILDIMFPDKPTAGFDLARKIKKSGEIQDLPVIMLTSINSNYPTHFSDEDKNESWMPVQDFIEKGRSLPMLVEKVQKLLSKK
jgi:DNA-binding response OmpR family regulator